MNKHKNYKSNILPYLGVGIALSAVVAMTLLSQTGGSSTAPTAHDDIPIGGELLIDKNLVTQTASFHPYNSNGTYMEVIAVLDSNGEVRTALNTCQVCYTSGRGYYEQLGDELICNNCGNRFTIDQIGMVKGGCNPVPLTDDMKVDSKDQISINSESLDAYAPMFEYWKS